YDANTKGEFQFTPLREKLDGADAFVQRVESFEKERFTVQEVMRAMQRPNQGIFVSNEDPRRQWSALEAWSKKLDAWHEGIAPLSQAATATRDDLAQQRERPDEAILPAK